MSTTQETTTDEPTTEPTEDVTVARDSPARDTPRGYGTFLSDAVAQEIEADRAREFVLEAARRYSTLLDFHVDAGERLNVDLTLEAEHGIVAVDEQLLNHAAEYGFRVAAVCEKTGGEAVGVSFVEVER